MNQFGRARRQGASGCHPHPDAGLPTRRIPYAELRALVVSLIDDGDPKLPDDDDDPDAAVREFDSRPTTYHPSRVAALPTRPAPPLRTAVATPPLPRQQRTTPPCPPPQRSVPPPQQRTAPPRHRTETPPPARPRSKRPTTLDSVLESLAAESKR